MMNGYRSRLLALLAIATVGCSGEGDSPSSLVTMPRILAIQAEPPVASFATPDVTLTALVVAPDEPGGELDDLSWRACSPWQVVTDPTSDCGPDNSLPLAGQGTAAELSLLALLEAFPPPDWYEPGGGAPGDPGTEPCPAYEYLDVTVIGELPAAERRLVAMKKVRVTAEPVPRTNPVVDAFTLEGEAAVVNPEQFEPGTAYTLLAAPRRDSLDRLCTDDGQTRLEPVRVHFYTDSGRLADPYIDVEYTAEDVEVSTDTVWTAPDQGTARLWVVAIDSDGGVGWQEFAMEPAEE